MVRIIRMRSQSVLVGMVSWEEVGRKRSQALIPSLCGILVYNDETLKTVFGHLKRSTNIKQS